MKIKSILAIVVFLIAGFASAQITSATVNGKIINDDQNAVVNAKITVIFLPTNSVFETVTDKKGRFSLDNLDVGGPYQITINSNENQIATRKGLYFSLGDNDFPKPIMIYKKEISNQTEVSSSNNTPTNKSSM